MMHDKHRQWIDARGIDPTIAEKFGLHTLSEKTGNWLVVPYTEAGRIVNRKYRLTAEKRHKMDTGAPLGLWNSDCLSHPEVLAGAPVIITEGEWDALATMTAGLPHVVSVPNGAPGERTSRPESATRYEFIWRHIDALDRVKNFIIATDGDAPGRALAADLVALLGADRCRFVTYPEPCKDLNDVALFHGHSTLVQVVNGAKPYPVKGLFRPDDFPPRPAPAEHCTGIAALDSLMKIVPGTLTVFTGWANIGKSTILSSIIAAQLAHDLPVCIAPFETDIDILRDSLRQCLMRCPSYELGRRDTSGADAIIRDRLTVIYQAVADDDDDMDLERFLDLCRVAVLQHGARMIVLDPWNELEHKRGSHESETEYTNRALRQMRKFAQRHNVAFWVVAHPAKPERGFTGVPKLYQISGSAAWANKPHYGLTYHRPDPNENAGQLHVTKVKQGLPGKKGSVDVTLDYRTWEFVEIAGSAP